LEVDIRLATWDDVDPFMELWEDYLISHERLGSDIRATDKTIGFFKELLLAYLDGDFLGVPLMAWVGEEPVGVLLWGQLPPAPFDLVEERCVTDFGTFTALRFRCMGVGTALRERVILELDAKGIRSVLGSVMMTNRAGV
jgi:GNAT superfamily N-acetyltransferase